LVGGIVHFGRMLDKIRLHAAGKLPADYHANLGKGFDGWCCQLLKVKYEDVVTRCQRGGTEAEILAWCFSTSRQPAVFEVEAFNDYLRKRGWNDTASERLAQRKQESGLADRADIQTFFDLIDADEGRPVHRPFTA
jgi:gluconokinase